MEKVISLKILLPDQVFFQQDIKSISFKTKDGSRSILPNHQTYCGTLADGNIRVHNTSGAEEFTVFTASIMFRQNDCLLIAEMAAQSDKVEQMLEERRKDLEKLYRDQTKGELEIRRVHMGIHRALVRGEGGSYGE